MKIVSDERTRIRSGDEWIQMNIFHPIVSSKAVIIFSAGVGIKQSFIFNFTRYFADNGYTAITFDFRTIGESKIEHVKKSNLNLIDWVDDLNKVIQYTKKNFNEKIILVAHSFGGQVFGLVREKLDLVVFIASQNGHYKYYNKPLKYKLYWKLLAPIVSNVLGYFPARRMGLGEDLSKNTMLQWRRWCLQKNYLLDDNTLYLEMYRQFNQKIISFAISDDEWGGPDAVKSLLSWYSNAEISYFELAPNKFNIDKIGHNGIFRMKDHSIWKYILNILMINI